MDKDIESINQARECVEAAHAAFKRFADFSQERVDAIVRAMAEAGLRAAEPLARMAVDETGFGRYEDKILKNKFGSQVVYDAIKDLKTVGIIREDRENGLEGQSCHDSLLALRKPGRLHRRSVFCGRTCYWFAPRVDHNPAA